MSVELTFPDRLEPYGPQPDTTPRRIMVQVWYPAEADDGAEPGPWTDDFDVIGPAMSRRLGFPGFFLSHTRYSRSHSFEDAPPLSGLFPLVIYSHGWTGFRGIAVNQAESLASHGYIVVAADHTYGAVITRFRDGTIAGFDPVALPDEATVEPEVYRRSRCQTGRHVRGRSDRDSRRDRRRETRVLSGRSPTTSTSDWSASTDIPPVVGRPFSSAFPMSGARPSSEWMPGSSRCPIESSPPR